MAASAVIVGLQCVAGIGLLSLGMGDGQRHEGFGAVGEHADAIEEQPLP